MDYAATILPFMAGRRLPLSRDQLMLLMMAANELFLAFDILLAHSISGSITGREWIPILFGPIAGILLLAAGWLAMARRDQASLIATAVFLASILVGLLGAYFHFVRAILPAAPPGEEVSIPLLVWAPPILGPLTFALVGVIGISAVWEESPPDSGRLILYRGYRLHLPYSKTRAYVLIIGLGTLATVISSVLDHARTGFENPWLWIPTVAGIFGTTVALGLGFMDHPARREITTFAVTMVALIGVGLLGAWLHIQANLTASGTIVGERFLRGAPFLAPLLYANMGTLGLIALLRPADPWGSVSRELEASGQGSRGSKVRAERTRRTG
jgi:hypothetical protein